MSVFDLSGPEFLEFYGLLMDVALATAFLLRWMLRGPGGDLEGEPAFDAYEIACLRQGAAAAVETAIARLVRELGIDGMIATNTTITRDVVKGVRNSEQQGGLSGAPIRALALKSIPVLREHLGGGVPLIAVGGIDSGAAAVAALQAGADLIQIYTGLIYRGPKLVTEILTAVRKS